MLSVKLAKLSWIETSVGAGWTCGDAGDSAAYAKVDSEVTVGVVSL